MKTNESFSEKVSLSSSMLNEDCLSLGNFPKEINNFTAPIQEKIQNFKHSIFDSNFSNQNNSNSQIIKAISSKTINAYEEKKNQEPFNYFSYEKSSNDVLKINKKLFFENGQKLWSQIGTANKSMNQYSKNGINGVIWNTNEIKDINDINEFQDLKIKEDMNNGNNGTLNDFTQNLNDLINKKMFNDKNNKNINGRINCALIQISQEKNELIKGISDIKNNSTIFKLENKVINNYISINNFNYIKNSSEISENQKNNENSNFENYIFYDLEEKENFINFKILCENLTMSLIDYICSKQGSKKISKCLNQYSEPKIHYLIEQLYMDFELIICNKYGNYFFQKLYIKSQKSYRIKILNLIKDCFFTVSKDETGVLAIQQIIEVMVSDEERNKIINYIYGNELEMSLDKEGTHLIQRIIENFPEKDRQDLTNVLCTSSSVKKLLKNINGVHIIKRLIEQNKNSFNRNKLIQALYSNINKIINTSYGCYIIYYLIKKWGINSGIIFINVLIYNFEFYANNKQSAILIYKVISICKDNLLLYLHDNVNFNKVYNCNEFIILKILILLFLKLNIYNEVGKVLFDKVKLLLTS